MKLKIRLSIIVIAVLVAVVATISIVLLNKATATQMATALKSTERLAAEQAKDIQRREEIYLQTAKTLANIMGDYKSVDPSVRRTRYNETMEAILEANPNFIGIYSVWKPNALDGMDAEFAGQAGYTDRGQYAAWYSRASGEIEYKTWKNYRSVTMIATEEVHEPEAQIVNGKTAYTFNISVPVIAQGSNEVVGVVGINVIIDGLQGYVENIIKNNHEIDVMSVYSKNGTVLASIVPERVGKDMHEADAALYTNEIDLAYEAIQNGKITHLREYSPVLKINLRMVLCPIAIGTSENPWTIMMSVSEETILADIRQMTLFTILIAGIFIVVSAVGIYFVASGVTKPIVKISAMLKDISEGEGDLTKRLNVASNDEIGAMAHFFNLTLDKIKNLVITIKNQTTALSSIGTDLASNMTETAAAVNQITANIESIKGQVINQSASVVQTGSTMSQVTTNIDKLNNHVEDQSASVSQSSSAIEEMLANISSVTQTLIRNAENVQHLAESSQLGRNAVQTVSMDIQEIAKESMGLSQINAVMKDISAQTNLLSMNAAIEAAHAGTAGKGFAVVADEIRKLAESSSNQSKTISEVLVKIKEGIEKIVGSTNMALNKFEAIDMEVKTVSDQTSNIKDAMEEQQTGSRQILEAVGQLNEITLMVKNGSMEMLEGSKEVISESENLGRVTEEISNGMTEMAAGANQINVAVHRVNEISVDNREQINTLVAEVEKFKVA
ncbi:methyl-accepting chemotaxis protein [Treponema primitia ZAS-2]|uniref:Methyl-accepting chemotaxis protein n=1 Tax=Treponema primitia (strain ATCC BAA-887 / DSM 12427 / ZAS-2) TaxID=545694 RepID=F5YMW2_TREPZ|nr:methyl-accepting chemotaxis protein [Treponema primitia]AEF83954.1 methyl-accepting chemotaxis protein [Treponema primitia ZAS-2]